MSTTDPHLPDDPQYVRHTNRKLVMSKRELDSRFYSDRIVAPLAAWVHQHRGAMAEVTRRVSSFMGKPVLRQMVERWLSLDPEVRCEPSFGSGMVLVRVIRTMRTEYTNGLAPEYTTGPIQIDPTSVKPEDSDLPEGRGEPPVTEAPVVPQPQEVSKPKRPRLYR